MSELRADGVPIAEAADRASVESGCDGACWFRDGAELLVSVRAPRSTALTVR